MHAVCCATLLCWQRRVNLHVCNLHVCRCLCCVGSAAVLRYRVCAVQWLPAPCAALPPLFVQCSGPLLRCAALPPLFVSGCSASGAARPPLFVQWLLCCPTVLCCVGSVCPLRCSAARLKYRERTVPSRDSRTHTAVALTIRGLCIIHMKFS